MKHIVGSDCLIGPRNLAAKPRLADKASLAIRLGMRASRRGTLRAYVWPGLGSNNGPLCLNETWYLLLSPKSHSMTSKGPFKDWARGSLLHLAFPGAK